MRDVQLCEHFLAGRCHSASVSSQCLTLGSIFPSSKTLYFYITFMLTNLTGCQCPDTGILQIMFIQLCVTRSCQAAPCCSFVVKTADGSSASPTLVLGFNNAYVAQPTTSAAAVTATTAITIGIN